MTDSIVEIVIKSLASLIATQLKLVAGVEENLKAIQNELRSISAFLKSAEESAEEDYSQKEWVKQVRELSYDIEDVIEDYQLFRKENVLNRAIQNLRLREWRIASSIKSIRQRASDIKRNEETYRLRSDNSSLGQRIWSCSARDIDIQLAISSLRITEEFELVGAEVAKQEIIDLLHLGEPNLTLAVVAVVGMRGVGKTSVVGSIFREKTLRDFFPVRAWISISRPCNHLQILRSMINQLHKATGGMRQVYNNAGPSTWAHSEASKSNDLNHVNTMDESSLHRELKKILTGKRCMVVLDDVQEGDTDLLDYIKSLLHKCQGSKLLMTTRYEKMARASLHDSPYSGIYKLKPLSSQKAWELFCKKTFQNSDQQCPSSLERLARDIVKKCDGLPLTILAIGRLLSTMHNSQSEWQKVYDSIGYYLEKDSQLTRFKKLFLHSYHDLPYYLKPCFLYFGLFPRDHIIDQMRLIRLWIAEGFIDKRDIHGNLTLEDVAEEYLNELIGKSLIQVEWTDPTGKHKSFRVHESLREIILSKLDELSFCKIMSMRNDNSDPGQFRRLSIQRECNYSGDGALESIASAESSIRSIILIDVSDQTIPVKVIKQIFQEKFRLLRVLDLQNASTGDDIPSWVGKLRNLYYLSLRNTRVRYLPKSIGKLQNLQTLDLKLTSICELPIEIGQLKKLRHLLIYSYESDPSFCLRLMKTKGVKIPAMVLMNLSELQKVAFVEIDNNLLLNEMKMLVKLRRLGITKLNNKDSEALCVAIQRMTSLRTLSIYSTTKDEVIDLENVSPPPLNLQRLYLNGPLSVFPRWIAEITSLVKIRLRWSKLLDDPFKILKELPNLVELQLLEAFDDECLQIDNVGFEKLKILHLLDLHNLVKLSMSEGALPDLQELSIGESPRLELPLGIQFLSSLKTLEFYDMPWYFINCIQPGGQFYYVVEHVPDVFLHYKPIQHQHWQTHTLR